jgi:hypothetical protein
VEKHDAPDETVRTLLNRASPRDGQLAYYAGFTTQVSAIRDELREMLSGLKRSGAKIVGYGAAAKGTIMLNYTGIGPETLDFVVDRNVHKQGRYMPGVRLRVEAPKRILEAQPDYLLILPWNFRDEIVEQQAEFRCRGGRFIVLVPRPRIL